MLVAVLTAVTFNVVLFAVLTTWAAQAAWREPPGRVRPLLWLTAAAAGAFVVSSSTRLMFVAARLELLDSRIDELVGSAWILVPSLLTSVFAVVAAVVLHRFGRALARSDQVAMALSEQLVGGLTLDGLDLTPREHEVVALLGRGIISDRDIADELVISPATAGTHVRNVLRKAGLHDRRELALLALATDD